MLRVACLALAAVFLLTTAEDELPSLGEVQKKCREEFKLNEEDVTKLNNTKYLETKDEKIQCFVKCILTGFKLMNDAGDIMLENMRRSNDTKVFRPLVACSNVTGTDPCDKAVSLQNCLLKHMEEEEQQQQPPE